MKTIFKLTSINYESKTGKLLIRKEDVTKWTVITVNLNSLLMYRILNRKTDKRLYVGQDYVNTEYSSEDTGTVYRENPFQLIHFVPSEGSTMQEHYTLDVVDHYTIKLREQIKMKMVDYESVSHLLGKYIHQVTIAVKRNNDNSLARQYALPNITHKKL